MTGQFTPGCCDSLPPSRPLIITHTQPCCWLCAQKEKCLQKGLGISVKAKGRGLLPGVLSLPGLALVLAKPLSPPPQASVSMAEQCMKKGLGLDAQVI